MDENCLRLYYKKSLEQQPSTPSKASDKSIFRVPEI
jgi:hypothetical protein